MSVKLSKGHRINLSKDTPGLTKVAIGLGWDVNPTDTGTEFDLDVSVFMLGDNGKIPEDEYFVFYNNLKSPDGSPSDQPRPTTCILTSIHLGRWTYAWARYRSV